MEDRDIIELFWNRDCSAISVATDKYQSYCRTIIGRILTNKADIDECINDVYFKLWNSIPPNNPGNLTAYLAKIARNAAFDKYKKSHAARRGGGEIPLVLDELSEITASSAEAELDKNELSRAINSFLDTLPKKQRFIFVCRYWYAYPIEEIARKFGKSPNYISVSLNRTRAKLKTYLMERGFEL